MWYCRQRRIVLPTTPILLPTRVDTTMKNSDSHHIEKRENNIFFECENGGRGTTLPLTIREDMHWCPFCGNRLSESIPAYLS